MVFLEKGTLSWKNSNENMRHSARGERENSGTLLFIKGELVLLNVKHFNSILSFLTSTFTDQSADMCCGAFRDRDKLALIDS